MGGTFTGYQYDARIYGMDKTVGYIVLRVDHLVIESGRFNVCFVVQEEMWTGAARALEDLGAELRRADSKEITGRPGDGIKAAPESEGNKETQGFVRRMLFPEKDDGVWQTTLSLGNFKRRWFDGELNYEQQVRMAFDGLQHAPLFFHCIIRRRVFALSVDELHLVRLLLWKTHAALPAVCVIFFWRGKSEGQQDGR